MERVVYCNKNIIVALLLVSKLVVVISLSLAHQIYQCTPVIKPVYVCVCGSNNKTQTIFFCIIEVRNKFRCKHIFMVVGQWWVLLEFSSQTSLEIMWNGNENLKHQVSSSSEKRKGEKPDWFWLQYRLHHHCFLIMQINLIKTLENRFACSQQKL